MRLPFFLNPVWGSMTMFSGQDQPFLENGPFVPALVLSVAVDHPLFTLQNHLQGSELRLLFGADAHAEADLLPPAGPRWC